MLTLGGVKNLEYYFEKENLIILKENFKYACILLNENVPTIYLIDHEGIYSKYELSSNPINSEGKWLIRGDVDAIKIGMLATLIR